MPYLTLLCFPNPMEALEIEEHAVHRQVIISK
jgi:hypothetical protein